MDSTLQTIVIIAAIIVLIAAGSWLYFSQRTKKIGSGTGNSTFRRITPRMRREERRKTSEKARQARQDFLSQWGENQLEKKPQEEKAVNSPELRDSVQPEDEVMTQAPGKNGKPKRE